jgi:hypothetical protein
MKALKPMILTIGGRCFKMKPNGKEIPQVVVDYWKKNDQLNGLVKDGSISDGNQKSQAQPATAQPTLSDSGSKK